MVSSTRTLLSSTRCRTIWARRFAMDSTPGHLKHLFNVAVNAVLPHHLINKTVRRNGDKLVVNDRTYELNRNCHVVGFGKAVLGMSAALEGAIKDHLVSGIISVPTGIQDIFCNKLEMTRQQNTTKIQILEGAENNIPDSNSLFASKKIADLVENLNENSLLFVLISGGGSALLPSPIDSIDFKEKSSLIQDLAKRGADINEMNCVRKRLSKLKGGGLAVAAHPAQVIALILSDVIGDPLGTIASGPTCVNTEEVSAAFDILVKYDLVNTISDNLRSILTSQQKSCQLPTTGNDFDHVNNVLMGNNQLALQAAFDEASKIGYIPVIICSDLQGIARNVGNNLAQDALKICSQLNGDTSDSLILEQGNIMIAKKLRDAIRQCQQSKRGLCLIFGGETTVLVKGTGRGGRNQEMALSFSLHLHKNASEKITSQYSICLLSAGTDGIDGPTDAAGAVAYPRQIIEAVQHHLDAKKFLDNNDSNSFYSLLRNGQDLVKTGHTGTNVMDLQILVVKPVNNSCKY